MSDEIESARLLNLVAHATDEPWASLQETLAARTAPVTMLTPTPAAELLQTYTIRYRRWHKDGIPRSVGFPSFVDALRQAGKRDVRVAAVDGGSGSFVVLMSSDAMHALGCLFIVERRRDPLPAAAEAAILTALAALADGDASALAQFASVDRISQLLEVLSPYKGTLRAPRAGEDWILSRDEREAEGCIDVDAALMEASGASRSDAVAFFRVAISDPARPELTDLHV